jgi:hypothetical protein
VYDPITINHYALLRHEELMREVDAFWEMKLAREERGEHLRPEMPRKTAPQRWVAQLLTALHR